MSIKLSRFVGVRFKPDDYQRLEEKAEELGMTVSEFLRAAALGISPAPRRRQLVDQGLINQLSRLGNNLNQQTRLFHQLRHRDLLPETAPIRGLLEELRALLVKVSQSVAEVAR